MSLAVLIVLKLKLEMLSEVNVNGLIMKMH